MFLLTYEAQVLVGKVNEQFLLVDNVNMYFHSSIKL